MPSRRLCFFGDSFVQGCGDPDMLGWVGRVCATQAGSGHDLTVYNLGIRGQTSGEIAARWQAEASPRLAAQQFHVRGLVFSFGANDSAQGIPLATTLGNAGSILRHAVAFAPTLLVGPAPIADSPHTHTPLATMCAALAGLASQYNVAYHPIHHILLNDQEWMSEALAGDGAHPSRGGYQALANQIEGWPAWRDWFHPDATPAP